RAPRSRRRRRGRRRARARSRAVPRTVRPWPFATAAGRGTARPRPLAALEVRSALLREGREPLARVRRGEREVERAALVLQPELQRRLVRAVDGFLREPGRHRSLGRDVARDALRLLQPRLLRDDA